MADKSGGPAFPIVASEYGGHGSHSGMSLRDYFAAKAMQAMIGSGSYCSIDWDNTRSEIADLSYCMADAMLETRK